MNGAESLVHTLLKSGVDTCFANPGTSEMHFVAALDRISGMRCILGLFEGVVAGAADGYSRISGKPAANLLHCGPGLANALAGLHNARRARSSIVNIVGDHATYHKPFDPPLAADTEGWARGVSSWVRTSTSAARIGEDAALAVSVSRMAPGNVVTLIAPSDSCWDEDGCIAQPMAVPQSSSIDNLAVTTIAAILRREGPSVLILGGRVISASCLKVAQAISEKTGARILAQQYNARVERGQGRYPISRIPYSTDQALAELEGCKNLILAGASPPTAFFAYPNKPSFLFPKEASVHVLSRPEQSLEDALNLLADELNAKPVNAQTCEKPHAAEGAVTSENVGRTIAALLPAGAIICDESVSFGRSFFDLMAGAAPHDYLQATMGGAIGQGLPLGLGAAVAAPDRRVVCLEGDGSAMYTLQALWTHAREKLDITTVILSNRKYSILVGELAGVGANPGPTAFKMLSIDKPDLGWVHLAKGLGVEAVQVSTLKKFADVFQAANKAKGPFLIELLL